MRNSNLFVDFCGITFPNPLVLASGGLGETADKLITYLEAGASAVITRTTRLHVSPERKVFPSPHLYLSPRWQYLLNSEWGNLVHWEYWIKEGLPKLKDSGIVIVSISGRDIENCIELAKIFDKASVSLFEINVSCSHSGLLYGHLTNDENHVFQLVTALKKHIKAPIMIKLGWSHYLPEIASTAEKAGADAISTTNAIGPGLDIDMETGRPHLGIKGGMGGVSGKSIFPIALQCVHEVVEAVNIPVMGVGGISSYQDVLKMLLVGASCVQIYTEAFLRGPKVFSNILKELTAYLQEHGIESLSELQGKSRPFLKLPSELIPQIPIVDDEKCPACGVCPSICPVDAIDMDEVAVINENKCIGCGVCVQACPPKYDAIRLP